MRVVDDGPQVGDEVAGAWPDEYVCVGGAFFGVILAHDPQLGAASPVRMPVPVAAESGAKSAGAVNESKVELSREPEPDPIDGEAGGMAGVCECASTGALQVSREGHALGKAAWQRGGGSARQHEVEGLAAERGAQDARRHGIEPLKQLGAEVPGGMSTVHPCAGAGDPGVVCEGERVGHRNNE